MSSWTIYYNPKCGTCRKTLDRLKAKKISPAIVEYLKTPPTLAELKEIVKKVGGDAHAIVRSKEPVYEELGLGPNSSQSEIIYAILKEPVLLQRPIVVRDDRAVVARPPEQVDVLF